MPKMKLTTAVVERLGTPAEGRVEYFDQNFPAFALRITARGSRSWVVFYRYRGHQRRLTLGSYPTLGLAEARVMAREALKKVEQGIDPADEKRAARERPSDTFEAVAEQFLQRYAKHQLKTWRSVERTIQRELVPVWGAWRVTEISRRHVLERLDQVMDRGTPYAANRLLAMIRRFFNWCLERGIVEASPAAGVRAPGRETRRERVLSGSEIRAVWRACEEVGYPFGPLFQFLLITGQRLGEAGQMRWNDLADWTWTIPDTKSGRGHEVPLPSLAVGILEALPRFPGPYVFTSSGGERPVARSGYLRAKRKVDALSHVADWRIHDLRRTAATGMAELGIEPHITEKVLNHASGMISGVAAVYNRYGYHEEKRCALEAWSNELEYLIRVGDSTS